MLNSCKCFSTSCLNVVKLMFLFIELGNFLQTEGPIYETFPPHVSFTKRNLKCSVIISWTYSTLWSIFQDFHVIRACIIDIIKNCEISALLYSLINSQPINCFEIFFRDLIHFVKFWAEMNAFILHYLQFFLSFTLRLRYHAEHA